MRNILLRKRNINRRRKNIRNRQSNNSFFNKGFFQNAALNILYSIIAMIIGGLIITNFIEYRTRQLLFANKLSDIAVKVNNELYKEALTDILAIKTEIPIKTKKHLLAEYYHYEGICSINISLSGQQQEAYLQEAVFALLKGLEVIGGYKGNFDFSSSNAKHLVKDISIVKKHKTKQSKLLLDLGNAFLKLADIRNSARNANQAINIYNLALSIDDIKNDNENYAAIMNQSALSYWKLAMALSDAEEKKKNLDLAYAVFENVLKLRENDADLEKYSDVINNQGLVNITYTEIYDDDVIKKEELLYTAIERFNKCLEYRDFNHNIIKYGKALNNLGVCYRLLSGCSNKEYNIRKAIEYFSESLLVRSKDKDLIGHCKVLDNLGASYIDLSDEVKDKKIYINKAIDYLNEASKIIVAHEYPENYERILQHLGKAYEKLAEEEDFEENMKNAQKYLDLHNKIRQSGKIEL